MSDESWIHGPRIGQRGRYKTMLFRDGSISVKNEDGAAFLLNPGDIDKLMNARAIAFGKSPSTHSHD